MLLWVIVVLVALRYRRNSKSLLRARDIVLGTHGDLTFGKPEPMSSFMNPNFEAPATTGGEIDPETGEMVLFGAGTGNDAGMPTDQYFTVGTGGNGAMPMTWGGLKGNPLFGKSPMDWDGDGSTETGTPAEVGLDDLSDFEEEDFESFADSLLESSAFEGDDGEFAGNIFGSSAGQVGMATVANNAAWDALQTNLGQGIDELDDLSDFEDSDADADADDDGDDDDDDDSSFGRPGSASPMAVVARPQYEMQMSSPAAFRTSTVVPGLIPGSATDVWNMYAK